MKMLWALIVARNKEFYRDRSAMIWSLLFPFIVLMGFTYGYSGREEPLLRVSVLAGAESAAPALIQRLKDTPGLELLTGAEETAAMKKLQRYQTDLLVAAQTGLVTYSFNPDSSKGKLAERLIKDAVTDQAEPRPRLEARAVEGRHIRYSDWLLPGLLAMNIMFGSMFGVGYVIVRYRKNGVLKRLRATPLSAFQFLTAQVISRMLLMLLTASLVIGGSVLLIGFRPQGSWTDLLIFLAASSAAMISVGLVVAARISSEEVADGVLNLMTWPMIFLSGIWFSLDGASPWVLKVAQFVPLSHVVYGLRAILIDGVPLAQLTPQLFILLGLSAILVVIGSVVFRWR